MMLPVYLIKRFLLLYHNLAPLYITLILGPKHIYFASRQYSYIYMMAMPVGAIASCS